MVSVGSTKLSTLKTTKVLVTTALKGRSGLSGGEKGSNLLGQVGGSRKISKLESAH